MKRACPLPLPKGWKVLDEKYELQNDQGLSFVANLLTSSHAVVSLFLSDKGLQVHTFELMLNDYKKTTTSLHLEKKFNLRFEQNCYPIYIIAGENSRFAQCFVEKDGKLFCLITSLCSGGESYADFKRNNPVLADIEQLIKVAK